MDDLQAARPFIVLVEEKGKSAELPLEDYDLSLEILFTPKYDARNFARELLSLGLVPLPRYQHGYLEARFFRASNRELVQRYFFKSTARGWGSWWLPSTLPSQTMEEWGHGFARLLVERVRGDRAFFDGLQQRR